MLREDIRESGSCSWLSQDPAILFIAFFWSLPLSLYLAMTPSIFKLFLATSLCYLLVGILMGKSNATLTKSGNSR